MIPVAFWDASLPVPLCVNQPPYSENARELFDRYEVCSWWATSVEVEGAICRLSRSEDISSLEGQMGQAELDRLSDDWFLI